MSCRRTIVLLAGAVCPLAGVTACSGGAAGRCGDGDCGRDESFFSLHLPERLHALRRREVDLGGDHSCGLRTDYRLYCRGSTGDGQIGTGSSTGDFLGPVQVGVP